MRGWQLAVQLVFGRMIDSLAEKLGMDPIDLAIKNFGHAWGACPDPSLQAVLGAGAQRIGWAEKRTHRVKARCSGGRTGAEWAFRCTRAGMPSGRRNAAGRCRPRSRCTRT